MFTHSVQSQSLLPFFLSFIHEVKDNTIYNMANTKSYHPEQQRMLNHQKINQSQNQLYISKVFDV